MDLLPEVFAELQQGRLPSTDVLTLVATRFVGYAMTLAACFVKLPQILKISKQKSTKGLSVTSFELEVAICVIHVLYCYLSGMPFSSFGEGVAALVQNCVLLMQLYYHGGVSLMRQSAVWASYVGFAACALSGKLSMEIMTSAFLMNQVFFIVGRSIQIFTTASEGDASQLSIGSYGSVVLGKTIRILTSLREGATLPLMFANFLGFSMNAIAVLQIMYYNRKGQARVSTEQEKKTN